MSQKTSIEWTDLSANPIRARHRATGKVGWHCVMPSPGCANCYSHALNGRFGTGLPYNRRSEDEIELFLDLKPLEKLARRRTPSKVFLCDMTDLFGEFVPFEWVDRILAMLAGTPHAIQVLTKRAGRARDYFAARECPGNLWMGVSCEDQRRADERIPALLGIPAAVRFLSVEPLLGPIDLRPWLGFQHEDDIGIENADQSLPREQGVPFHDPWVRGIDWAIIGGESGKNARPCNFYWIRSIVDQCEAAGVACFVKQWGRRPFFDETGGDRYDDHTFHKLRDPKGGDPAEWPEPIRVREFPR